MNELHLQTWQWTIGALVAVIAGFSKTGVPGSGIVMVPMMAAVFGGRLSVGAMLPMLIFADCFAVTFYRTHANKQRLKQLAPWVIGGIVIGTIFLKYLGTHVTVHDPLKPIIGVIVLVMLAITLLRSKLGDRLLPHSPTGTALTGAVAGFSTMVANAAGPVMQIFFIASGMPKNEMMGTTATYFFIFNLLKVPFLLWLTWDNPTHPLITLPTLQFNVAMFPLILLGALLGRKLLPIIPQRAFNNAVLVLSALAALYLFVSY